MGVQVGFKHYILQFESLSANKRFEPEARNGLKEEGRKKTVTFAGSPMVASPSVDSLGSALRWR